ncbi:alpha/beta hydrolase [Streptomyces sp. NPDC088387]|uniref:alpha/beta hydrolase n=1 Tax=Streptomyces sp. NPDC088387 TaxID=3365859 RepID=UPI003820B72F
MRARTLAATAVVLAATGGTAHAGAPLRPAPADGRAAVETVRYHLGDSAYELPGTGEPVELAATVHYPKNLGGTPHPVVVALHGWHETCADADAATARDKAERAADWDAYSRANQRLFSWPCAAGVRPIDNDRGYDYMGERLAAEGFVFVSVRANGLNAASLSGDDNASARADLINRHLALWQRLSSTGAGALAGRFTDAATGRSAKVDFAHHVDMGRVGTLGHSRGGAGVTWQAADSHRSQWPSGVRVKAVLALAPAYNVMTEDMSAYRVHTTPLAVMRGTCDGQVGLESFGFAADATAEGKADTYEFGVHGGNHNYFNTKWSPGSGEVAADDDAHPVDGRPGRCTDIGESAVDVQLTESRQRRAGLAYVEAFFRRYLLGESRFSAVLEGREHPVAHIADVDVKATVRTS